MIKSNFIFPGQGSQSIGMALPYLNTQIAKNIFDKTSDALGYDILDICNNGTEEQLQKTMYTQPAIFSISVIVDSILKDNDINPIAVAGHSLGEYSALVSCEALTFKDALNLLVLRSSEMEKANNIQCGSMAAIINAEQEVILSVIENTEGVLTVANYNSEMQTVISGEKKSIESAIMKFKDISKRIRCIELNVSGAFHSPLMSFAREALSEEINSLYFSDAKVPIYHNYDAKPTTISSEIKRNLILQLESPVRWQETLQNIMTDTKNKDFIECGPGNVLAGINRRISKSIQTLRTDNMECINSIICQKN